MRNRKRAEEYSKSVEQPAKIGETIQLIERGVAPVRAGAKFAVVASLVACIVSLFALGWAVLR